MFTKILAIIFKREQKIPDAYLRMVKSEYRSVPIDYVEYFLEKNERLPTPQELQNAI